MTPQVTFKNPENMQVFINWVLCSYLIFCYKYDYELTLTLRTWSPCEEVQILDRTLNITFCFIGQATFET